jgi:HAD superfamily phosphoserine phosphatase-like hydrolase
MNVYDFDDTIYDGDSTLDFFRFCHKNYKKTYRALPRAVFGFGLFKLRIISKRAFKQHFFSFLRYVPDIDVAVSAFWNKNERKIWSWYLEQKQSSDVIISASPEFLLDPICQRLGVKLIASKVDKHTGVFTGENCYGAEKVKRLKSEGEVSEIDAFYSDSLSDKPLVDIAKKAYFVREGQITDWEA